MSYKKRLLTILSIGIIGATSLQAGCRDVIFGPPAEGNVATSYSAYYATRSKVYYDENKELQIRSFNDAYVDFFKGMVNQFEKDCKDDKTYLNPVNVTVNQIVDKDYFYFTATANFEKRK